MTDAADSELDGIARRRVIRGRKHFLLNLRRRVHRRLGSSEGGKSGNQACNRDIPDKIAARNKRVSHGALVMGDFGAASKREVLRNATCSKGETRFPSLSLTWLIYANLLANESIT
jgi:hypothetical protein